MPISINGSGSITGLSAGGLPDGCVTAGDLAAGAARSNFGSGAILQVQRAFGQLTRYTMSVTTWAELDNACRVTITPASSSSKLLIMSQIHTYITSSNYGAIIPVVSDGTTDVAIFGETDSGGGLAAASVLGSSSSMAEMYRNSITGGGGVWFPFVVSGLYQCASTATHTVKLFFKATTGTFYIGDNGPQQQLIVMEVA